MQDIELAIRDLMRDVCTADDLVEALGLALPGHPDGSGERFEDLTLGELISVLLHGSNFGRFFKAQFRANRELVRITVEPVIEIRNKVFHFREVASPEDLQKLRNATIWLRRKIRTRDGDR
ncbi:hypothetical protein QRX50_19975 [Amycolatopsis carbonis]|uniref:Swt1-like HEPN domain-containing protein n=1 Tax=Amycolatopsis carbonis TaxID=715471 RepID=A0A9Y2MVG8_9PSEU|nr:hypothetical protein [Amycolatopsis sp. 2-15]WIX82885.1 hypothetical protein QRX50_19975 [Amycolatopsis sp. 2-15]